MKKYVKPEMFFEDFELNQTVALNCGTVLGYASPVSCTVTKSSYIIGVGSFMDKNTCAKICQDSDEYCYYVNEDAIGVYMTS